MKKLIIVILGGVGVLSLVKKSYEMGRTSAFQEATKLLEDFRASNLEVKNKVESK